MSDFQIVMLDTLAGPKPLRAPAGWNFDKTGVHVWAALVSECRRTTFKLARDRHACNANIDVLANILANAYGMASFYWASRATGIAKEKHA